MGPEGPRRKIGYQEAEVLMMKLFQLPMRILKNAD